MDVKAKIYHVLKKILIYDREEKEINYHEAIELVKNNLDTVLLDVRSQQEYNEHHLNGAINIPLFELTIKAEKVLKKNKIIIVYCQSGKRSKRAYKILKRFKL